jgi:hypothetical protein
MVPCRGAHSSDTRPSASQSSKANWLRKSGRILSRGLASLLVIRYCIKWVGPGGRVGVLCGTSGVAVVVWFWLVSISKQGTAWQMPRNENMYEVPAAAGGCVLLRASCQAGTEAASRAQEPGAAEQRGVAGLGTRRRRGQTEGRRGRRQARLAFSGACCRWAANESFPPKARVSSALAVDRRAGERRGRQTRRAEAAVGREHRSHVGQPASRGRGCVRAGTGEKVGGDFAQRFPPTGCRGAEGGRCDGRAHEGSCGVLACASSNRLTAA